MNSTKHAHDMMEWISIRFKFEKITSHFEHKYYFKMKILEESMKQFNEILC